ncbi:GNAT family protein [Phenylobacterium sp.]|jgi:RimJ/RimL family protein N-acetyltransferase|uniref:GNAT family N-acetyltransferase n=1 Tax=Phenylobacterium sp. TaxID=1871053 RepID=UPI002F931D0A
MNDLGPAHVLPRDVECGGERLAFRLMQAADVDAVLGFARALPEHDLLFLRRDITHPKVVEAWARELEGGSLTSILAVAGDRVVGCATVVRDPLSWSPHVAELRIVLGEEMRGRGLGALLTQEAFALALAAGSEKIFAQMTVDQKGAIAIFEGLGFSPEAMLRDHVRDRSGRSYDLVVLSHDVARVNARHAAYGLDEAF